VETELKPVVEAAQQGRFICSFATQLIFVLQPFLCSLWCAFRVFIKASAGRNRINVLGAVNAITKEVITLSNTTYITSDTLIQFLKMRKEKYNDKPIAIVLDNARYQQVKNNLQRRKQNKKRIGTTKVHEELPGYKVF
jgi:hypothetical protein